MKEKLAQQNIEQWQKKADGHVIDVERLSDAWSEKNHCAFLLSGCTSHSMSCYFLS